MTDNQDRMTLAHNAWKLYKQAVLIESITMDMFFEEIMELEEKEEELRIQQEKYAF